MSKEFYEPPKIEYSELDTEDVLEVSLPGRERTVGEDDTAGTTSFAVEDMLWLFR